MKRWVAAVLTTAMLAGCSKGDVADVSLGIFTFKDIEVNAFVDPLVPGVTCHVASIKAPLSLTDPADSAVSCRQTGDITPIMIERIRHGGNRKYECPNCISRLFQVKERFFAAPKNPSDF